MIETKKDKRPSVQINPKPSNSIKPVLTDAFLSVILFLLFNIYVL